MDHEGKCYTCLYNANGTEVSLNVLLCGGWIHARNKDGIFLCDHIVATTTATAAAAASSTAAATAAISYKTEEHIRNEG